jgi:serine/threonine protein kinase
VIYEMLTGHPPYCDDKPEVVVGMHSKLAIPSLRAHCPHEVSEELEMMVTKLLAKSPKARYQTAGEVVSALAELLQE